MEKLLYIQQNLKCPKSLFNSFGNYKYRSAETILEAVKPLLQETKTVIIISDDLVNIGERYYIKAFVKLIDCETKEVIAETTSFAKEEEQKKGMDGSQITGASSSYARKYALNALLLIDDVQDSDTTNNENVKSEADSKPVKGKCSRCGKEVSQKQLDAFNGICANCKRTESKNK